MIEAIDERSSCSTSLDENDNKKKRTPKKKCTSIGLILSLIAGFAYSVNSVLAKKIILPAIQIAFLRCAIQVLILLPIVTHKMFRNNLDLIGSPSLFKLLVIRGVLGSTAAILLYQAIERISVGDAVAVGFLHVFVTGLVSYLWLKEAYSALDAMFAFAALAGVVLIAKPSFIFGQRDDAYGIEGVIGINFAIATAILQGITSAFLRKLSTSKIPATLNCLYYSICGTFITSAVMFSSGTFVYPCLFSLPYIVAFGISGLLGQLLLAKALCYERASTVSVVKTINIVITIFLQVCISMKNIGITRSHVGGYGCDMI